MSTEELMAKLTPGEPKQTGAGNDEFYPSGHADAVIFKIPNQELIHMNGQLVKLGTKRSADGKTFIAPPEIERAKIEHRALCYLAQGSKEDLKTPFGFRHRIGLVSHQGGLLDILTFHSKDLQKARETNQYQMWCACTPVGKDMMHPEILAFLKVIPVEEGIFAVVYDPDGEIPE